LFDFAAVDGWSDGRQIRQASAAIRAALDLEQPGCPHRTGRFRTPAEAIRTWTPAAGNQATPIWQRSTSYSTVRRYYIAAWLASKISALRQPLVRRSIMPFQRFAPMTKNFPTFDCDAHVTEPR